MKTNSIRWMTYTAMLLAMAIIFSMLTQFVGVPVWITGTLVNLVLIIAVFRVNLFSGIVIAVLVPLEALLIGKIPLWYLMPAVAAGNMALVITYGLILKLSAKRKIWLDIVGLGLGSLLKFVVMVILVQVLINELGTLGKPESVADQVIGVFASAIQLFTALAGSVIAILLMKFIPKSE